MHGRDRLDRVGATDRSHGSFREAEVLDLAFSDQVSDRPRHVFDRHVRIDAMLVEEVETSTLRRVSEASATSLMCSGRLSRSFKARSLVGSISNPNFVAITSGLTEQREAFAHELFVHESAVRLSRIEEGHPAFDRRPEERDHLPLLRGRA